MLKDLYLGYIKDIYSILLRKLIIQNRKDLYRYFPQEDIYMENK